jgi:hypothetical protein
LAVLGGEAQPRTLRSGDLRSNFTAVTGQVRRSIVLTAVLMGLFVPGQGLAAVKFGAQNLDFVPSGSGSVGSPITFTEMAAPTASTQPVAAPVSGVLTLIEGRYVASAETAYGYRILAGSSPNFTARPATPDGSPGKRLTKVAPLPNPARDLVGFVDSGGHPRGLPITAGERLAVFVAGNTATFALSGGGGTTSGATVSSTAGDHSSGSATYAPTFGGLELQLRGTIEPDADGDTYGDETQDNCPSIANDQTSNPCPDNPPDTAAPGVAFTVAGKKPSLHTALKKGIRLEVTADEAVSIEAEASARVKSFSPRGSALRAAPPGYVTLSRTKATLAGAGATGLTLKLTKVAKRSLAKRAKAKLRLEVTARDLAGNPAIQSSSLTLRD